MNEYSIRFSAAFNKQPVDSLCTVIQLQPSIVHWVTSFYTTVTYTIQRCNSKELDSHHLVVEDMKRFGGSGIPRILYDYSETLHKTAVPPLARVTALLCCSSIYIYNILYTRQSTIVSIGAVYDRPRAALCCWDEEATAGGG